MLINIFDIYYKSNFIFKVVILVDLGILVSLVVCQLIWGVFLQQLLVLLLVTNLSYSFTTMVDLPIVLVVLQIVFVVKQRILKVGMLKCIKLAIKRIRLMVGMLKCIKLAIKRIRLMVH